MASQHLRTNHSPNKLRIVDLTSEATACTSQLPALDAKTSSGRYIQVQQITDWIARFFLQLNVEHKQDGSRRRKLGAVNCDPESYHTDTWPYGRNGDDRYVGVYFQTLNAPNATQLRNCM